jgi:glycosyltransferase involved in cell wall biosynthesis
MMRVLHVGSGRVFGGTEAMLLTVAEAAADAGMTASFAFAFDARVGRELASRGHAVSTLGGARLSRPLSILRARRALRRVIDVARPDVVVYHGCWSLALLGGVARRAGLPFACWMHDVVSDGPLSWPDRIAGRVAPDVVIGNSHFTARGARRIFGDTPVAVIHCPVRPLPIPDPAARTRLRDAHGVRDGERVILQMGRVVPMKGQLQLLEALAAMRDRGDWTCWQVGAPQQGDEEAYDALLRERARALGIADRVKFLGWQSDVGAIYGAADLYCQPNVIAEAFGITFVEALYAGLPVIGPSVGGPAEIITPDVGAVVRPGDRDDLVATLRRFLDGAGALASAAALARARAVAVSDPQARLRELASLLHRIAPDVRASSVHPAPALAVRQ